MKVTIDTRKEIKESVEVELPYFFKRCGSYYGIFDVDSCYSFYPGQSFYSFTAGTIDHFTRELSEAEPISEEDFRVEYEKLIEKEFKLPAREITTANFQMHD